MSGSFHVQLDSLRTGGNGLGDAAERFAGHVAGLQAQLQGFGQPWGGDDIGSLIGAAYTEVAQYVFDCLGTTADELTSAATDLVGMADAYERADTGAADRLRPLADGLV